MTIIGRGVFVDGSEGGGEGCIGTDACWWCCWEMGVERGVGTEGYVGGVGYVDGDSGGTNVVVVTCINTPTITRQHFREVTLRTRTVTLTTN